MKTYKFSVDEIVRSYVYVVADTFEEAESRASQVYGDLRMEYLTTKLPPKNAVYGWFIADADGRSSRRKNVPNLVGVTRAVTGSMAECEWGLHASPTVKDAYSWLSNSQGKLFYVAMWGNVTGLGGSKMWAHYRRPLYCIDMPKLLVDLPMPAPGRAWVGVFSAMQQVQAEYVRIMKEEAGIVAL